MHRSLRISLLAGALAALAVTPVAGQTTNSSDDNFSWSGKMAAGTWLRVSNLSGSINVEAAAGDVAEVMGEKKWRRGDPAEVHFAVVKDGANVTICALWGDESTCDARGADHHDRHHEGGRDNDVSVHFTVKLPKGVKVDVNSVNGSLDVAGAQSDVQAETVNGHVDVTTAGGPVNAQSVNGSVYVRMGAMPGTNDLDFATVNGSITLEVPATLSAEIEMETVNGSLTSDFPLTISGRVNPRHLRATVGAGGRKIEMKTVNGSVELKKVG
jgi:hypothetical protein